jgi:hypothetical protein
MNERVTEASVWVPSYVRDQPELEAGSKSGSKLGGIQADKNGSRKPYQHPSNLPGDRLEVQVTNTSPKKSWFCNAKRGRLPRSRSGYLRSRKTDSTFVPPGSSTYAL